MFWYTFERRQFWLLIRAAFSVLLYGEHTMEFHPDTMNGEPNESLH